MVKMEVGKKYVCRDGKVRGPFKLIEAIGAFALADDNGDEEKPYWSYWFPTGRYLAAHEDGWDCLEVWKDKTKWLKVGEYYNYQRVMGGQIQRVKCVDVIEDRAICIFWRQQNPNGAVELQNYYLAHVDVDNENGMFTPVLQEAAPEPLEFPADDNVEQPF